MTTAIAKKGTPSSAPKKEINQKNKSKAGHKQPGAKPMGKASSGVKNAKPAKGNPVDKILVKQKSNIRSNASPGAVTAILAAAPAGIFPEKIKPMLATLVDKPFDENGWVYEVKWDGYRAVGFLNNGSVELKSRNDKSFNEKFYAVTEALNTWKINAVVDGEVVVLDDNGISNFGALQNWRSEADGILVYYLFDIMWLNGKDLTALPLTSRQAILASVVPVNPVLRISSSFGESGTDFFNTAKDLGLEGIIAKKANSEYLPGNRTKEWLKIKANQRQEVVIGGYTLNEGSDKLFSSLLVGVFENKQLVYTGKIGTGFNTALQKQIMQQFKPLVISKPPFNFLPDINKPSRFRPNPPHATATWLKPQLVCEVSYAEMTTDGVMRHPSFEGMRIDKNAADVSKEKAKPTALAVQEAKAKKVSPIVTPASKKERKTFLNPADETQVREVNGHQLKFTNLSKLYWPKEKISKRQMLNYYYQVAPYILPYLKDRPQSMNRHPNGITGESFYFKDVTNTAPEWVETFLYHSGADDRDRKYLVAKDEASLLYMASLGCIEMNPWHSRVASEDYPDWCIIDLDPGNNTFNQVIEAAQVTHSILQACGITAYPKTSGSTGIHIYIPLGAKYTYEQSKEFARLIARLVQEQLPGFTSIERAVKDRKGKMYIDFLQNRPQATIAAPYSLRPKPGATVSMPLHWHEVKKGLQMKDFNISNALERIKSEGDLFKPVLGKGINMKKAIASFENVVGAAR